MVKYGGEYPYFGTRSALERTKSNCQNRRPRVYEDNNMSSTTLNVLTTEKESE